MTAKEAIKSRCLDCAGSKCNHTDCALHGLAESRQGANRQSSIRQYCRWCMNGNPVNQCTIDTCGIYQYRASVNSGLRVSFIPLNLPQKPIIKDSGKGSESKGGTLGGTV